MFGNLCKTVSFLSCFLGSSNSSSIRPKHPSILDPRVDGSKRLKKRTYYCPSEAITNRRMCLTHSRNTKAKKTNLYNRSTIGSHQSIRNSRILSSCDGSIIPMRNPQNGIISCQNAFFKVYNPSNIQEQDNDLAMYVATNRVNGSKVWVREYRECTCSPFGFSRAENEKDIIRTNGSCDSAPTLLDFIDGREDINCTARKGRVHEYTSFVVEQLYGGGTLCEMTKEASLFNELQILAIVVELLKVLDICHTNRIIHGNLNTRKMVFRCKEDGAVFLSDPLLAKSGFLKLIDFGSAQYIGYGKIVRRGRTPALWSPERYAGAYDEMDDIFALGAIIYNFVTKRPPFFSADEVGELNYKQLAPLIYRRLLRFERSEWHSFSPEMVDFVSNLLRKEPTLRMSAHAGLDHPWVRAYRDKAHL